MRKPENPEISKKMQKEEEEEEEQEKQEQEEEANRRPMAQRVAAVLAAPTQ